MEGTESEGGKIEIPEGVALTEVEGRLGPQTTPQIEKSRYEGIGGWLILPLLGLVVKSFRTFKYLYEYCPSAFEPNNGSLIIFETLGNAFFFFFAIVLIVLFFKHSRRVPILMVVFFLSGLLFLVADHVMAQSIPAIAAENDPDLLKKIDKTVIACAIWIPYFLWSKRVKATFTR